VPEIAEREGGVIERFAGDGLLAIFNALGDEPDHALRAARAALAVHDRTEDVRGSQPHWPRFRVALNTGLAGIGIVGSAEQRSFSAIGDTTNVAPRLQSVARPGEVVIGAETGAQLGDGAVELQALFRDVVGDQLFDVDARLVKHRPAHRDAFAEGGAVAPPRSVALEAVVDLASPEYHPLAKVAKDVGAGTVLITAIGSVIVGMVLFLPHLLPFVLRWLERVMSFTF